MVCYGSPCQDFSNAGKQAGSMWKCVSCGNEYNPITVHFSKRDYCPKCGCTELDKTRSSLLIEALRIIRANKPKWCIYENVKALVSKKFNDTFQMFLNELDEYGYNSYWQVLNAADYAIPQNRERVYVVSIRKDMDNGKFNFPKPIASDVCLRDILEDSVDEKYYVNTPKAQELIDNLIDEGKLDATTSFTVRGGGGSSHNQTSAHDLQYALCNKVSYCIDANYAKGTSFEEFLRKHRRQLVIEQME